MSITATSTSWLETWAYIMVIIVCFSILFTLLACSLLIFWKRINYYFHSNSNDAINFLNERGEYFKSPLSLLPPTQSRVSSTAFLKKNTCESCVVTRNSNQCESQGFRNQNSSSTSKEGSDFPGSTNDPSQSKEILNGNNFFQQIYNRLKLNFFNNYVSSEHVDAKVLPDEHCIDHPRSSSVSTIKSSIKNPVSWTRRNSSLPMSSAHSVKFNEDNSHNFEKTDSSDENSEAKNSYNKCSKQLYMNRKKNSDSGISEPGSYSSSVYSSRKNSSSSSSAIVDYYRLNFDS
jgi:hypothetical protein